MGGEEALAALAQQLHGRRGALWVDDDDGWRGRHAMARLLRSPDPLVSYQAATLLMEALPWYPQDTAWIEAIVLGPYADAGASASTAAGLTNLLEACRRVAAAVGDEEEADRDPEQKPGGGESVVLDARTRRQVLQQLAGCLAPLTGAVYPLRREAGGASEAEAAAMDLALAWLVKLARALFRRLVAPRFKDEEEGEGLGVLGLAVAPFTDLCNAAAAGQYGEGGERCGNPSAVEARREALLLALEVLQPERLPDAFVVTGHMADLLSVNVYPYQQGEEARGKGGEEEEEEDEETLCSLVRPAKSQHLVPYWLALMARTFRRLAMLRTADRAGWQVLFGTLLLSPLVPRFLPVASTQGEGEGEGEGEDTTAAAPSVPLVAALLDHDDLLVGALNDLLVAHTLLRQPPPPPRVRGPGPDWGSYGGISEGDLAGFLPRMDPAVLLAGLLEVVDETVLLEWLVSSETCALEYLVRAARHLLWRLGEEGGKVTGQGQGQREEAGTATASAAFLVGFGRRLAGMQAKGVLPFDVGPLVGRLRQLGAFV